MTVADFAVQAVVALHLQVCCLLTLSSVHAFRQQATNSTKRRLPGEFLLDRRPQRAFLFPQAAGCHDPLVAEEDSSELRGPQARSATRAPTCLL